MNRYHQCSMYCFRRWGATVPEVSAPSLGDTQARRTAADTSSEQNTCVICFETMNRQNSGPLVTCGHIFHHQCMKKWQRSTPRPGGVREAAAVTCPLCRHPILQKPTRQRRARS